jgi:hypothetical protein
LREIASYDPEAWRELGMAPWTQWAEFVRAGVRMANAETVVVQMRSWRSDSSSVTPAS